jgi:hypothetical protein
MTAMEKFKIGQRVRMTREGQDKFLDNFKPKRRYARVTGFPSSAFAQDPSLLVSVVRDGERSPRIYHMDFWEPDKDAAHAVAGGVND